MILVLWEDNYLAHHGIKGQHWGIRRYQNEDGSLTAEGKKRYGSKENFEKQQDMKRAQKDYIRTYNKLSNGFGILSRTADERLRNSKEIEEKRHAYEEAFIESLHSTINTMELSEKERRRASKQLQAYQNKRYKATIDNAKKAVSGAELNYDSKGHVVGISKKGETNMNMFFNMDPHLDAVYDSEGKLVAKRGA